MSNDGMGTHQPKNEDHYQCREVKAERDRLRQRVAELESQVEMLSTPHTNAWFEARHKERGERMKAMREWIENDPEDNGGISFVEHYGAYKWFDPETGEPL